MISTKISQNINNKLSLSPSSSLKRHPSAKNLLDNKGKSIEYEYQNNINKEYSYIEINCPSVKSEDTSDRIINNDFCENKPQYKISVIPIETKLFNNLENLYIKNEEKSIKKKKTNDLILTKEKDNNNFNCFNEFQKKLDQEITLDIISGKDFSSIQQKLSYFLKN